MRTAESEPLDDPWLTVAEISEELRCSPATVRSWISRGALPATRPGQRKLLVRRSDLDRMLSHHADPDSAAPPPAVPEVDRPSGRRQVRDSISSVTWTPEDRAAIDPEDWLGIAQSGWIGALDMSREAPPDAWFASRLTYIAESAARKADALTHFDDDEEIRWESEPAEQPLVLSYELRPGANRPGPAELWTRFDETVATLGDALEQARAGVLRKALEELSLALHNIAGELQRFRGRYGEWQEEEHVLHDEQQGSDGAP